ncbi:hypothetical protein [Agrobacterium vitis]|uniref:hypothetical protein n=1 Tax=Agrobacterium vitis TaxID=373 RepID=UPI001572D28F|nr:hypothetical protein [Agrobacterium vitis]NSZ16354.1 hypothetical protein [Agrobacterium vitis]QZO05109.1 hypothetical protein K4831_06165 [Agrobacterium vitis]UJL87257.1 hypothetical protein AVF2S5_04505 [Agrobacterium vitis]
MSVHVDISDKFEINGCFIPFYIKTKNLVGCYDYVSELLGDLLDDSLSVGVADVNETYCFHREGDFWVFYYSEKGRRTGGVFFIKLDDAIEFLHLKIESGGLR